MTFLRTTAKRRKTAVVAAMSDVLSNSGTVLELLEVEVGVELEELLAEDDKALEEVNVRVDGTSGEIIDIVLESAFAT